MKPSKILIALLLLSSLYASAKGNNQNVNLFKENKGQLTDQNKQQRNDILYYGGSDGLSYFFRNIGISYQLFQKEKDNEIQISRIDMTWLGANPNAKIVAGNKAVATDNFYNTTKGDDGIVNVRNFADLQYKSIYKGIDLHYYYKNGSLKYDFIVAPKADYKKIQVKIEGATSLMKNKDGTVSIVTPNGTLTEGEPVAFQGAKEVKTDWLLQNGVLSFQLADYDVSLPIVIDPLVYQWSKDTVDKGGASSTQSYFTAITGSVSDEMGNVYTSSTTNSSIALAYDNAKITKYNSSGNLIWRDSSFGSLSQSNPRSVAFEGIAYYDNKIYVCGATNIPNLATSGAYQTTISGQTIWQMDAFLIKYDSSGTKLWATYYGGNNDDSAKSCKTDAAGNVYICGSTRSTNNMSSSSAYQTVIGGQADAFIAKFDANGQRKWGTYFGGSNFDIAKSIDVNNNLLFVAGSTKSTSGIALPGAHQPAFSGNINGYLLCLDTSGAPQWSTYYGADSTIAENCIANNNYIYIAGTTKATGSIATSGTHQPTNAGGNDGFLVKFNHSGVRQWGTYYGGIEDDKCKGVAIGAGGKLYICGYTASPVGIATLGNYNSNYEVNTSSSAAFPSGIAYLAELDTAGQRISGTYYKAGTTAVYCSANSNGDIIISGNRIHYFNDYDGFIAKFSYCNMSAVSISASPSNICTNMSSVISTALVTGATYQWYRNDTLIAGAINNTYTTSIPAAYRVLLNQCPSSLSLPVSLTTVPVPVTQITKANVPCYGAPNGSITVTATSGTPPYSYTWDNLAATTATIDGLTVGTYIVHTSDVNSCLKTDTVVIDQNTTTSPSSPLASICAVTVDSATSKNLIIWEKTGIVNAFAYNLYRESNIAGQYDLIGTNPVSDYSTFLDATSIPPQQSYSYKIAEVDSCNHEWPQSNLHKTIHLSANVGINGEINLNWNQYEGKPYTTHDIMRSFNSGPFTLLNQVSSAITSYSDLTPPIGNKVYRIEIDLGTLCGPSKPTEVQRIKSNALSFGATGINDISKQVSVQIAPNPTAGIINILGNTPAQVRVYDATGRLLLEEKNKNRLDISSFPKGGYLIRLSDKEGLVYYSQKIILN